MHNRPVHFEIQAEDPVRCAKFYTDVFGWSIERWGEMEYWMCSTGAKDTPGIDGGILPRKGGAPENGASVNAFVVTMQVEHIDETIAKVEAAGGTLALAKAAIPGMAWQAYYKDTEGNIFGIHEADVNAK